jgi:hypothetical protein
MDSDFLMEGTLDLRLNDKIALVTGSTAGIGFAIARALAIEGAHVILEPRISIRFCSTCGAQHSRVRRNWQIQTVLNSPITKQRMERTMPTEINNPETPGPQDDAPAEELRQARKLDGIAERMSKRAQETERRYDQEHDIFTK